MQRMRGSGLKPHMDEVANVYGRNPDTKRALLIGSHTDTVPCGGWLDGALGVIYGLEIARAAQEEWKSISRSESTSYPFRMRRAPISLSSAAGRFATTSRRPRLMLPVAPAAILRSLLAAVPPAKHPFASNLPARLLSGGAYRAGTAPRTGGAAHWCCHRDSGDSADFASDPAARPITPVPRRWPTAEMPARRCCALLRRSHASFRPWLIGRKRHALEHRQHRFSAGRTECRAERRPRWCWSFGIPIRPSWISWSGKSAVGSKIQSRSLPDRD